MGSRRRLVLARALQLVASLGWAHAVLLTLVAHFLEPHTRVRMPVLNGTFAKSEASVAPNRIADISVVSSTGRAHLAAGSVWTSGADSTSALSLDVGAAGTNVVGVSLQPREIELQAEEFNAYLAE